MKKHLAWALALSILTMNTYTAWATVQVPSEENTETTNIETTVDSDYLNGTDTVPEVPTTEESPSEEESPSQEEGPTLEDVPTEGENQEESEVKPEGEADSSSEAITDFATASLGKIILKLGDKAAWMDGQQHTLDVAPTTKDGHTYVELRFIAENLVQAPTTWLPDTKQISISQGGKEIILTPGSNIASVDEMPVEMPGPVLVESGRTLVPLRFLSEEFGVLVDYKSADKTITLTTEDGGGSGEVTPPQPNIPPVADFKFESPIYTAGQVVNVIESSSDPDGDTLTDKQWMLDHDPSKISSSLGSIFRKPKEGIYDISLRVKDSKGDWSEWTTQTVQILPNEKPEVTAILTDKDSYAQGEEIKLDYTFKNESWEKITAVKWTYRQYGEADNKKISKAPERIFAPGQYVVTLQLQDEYGNFSEIKEEIITITNEVHMTEMEYKFSQGIPGTTIDNYNKINYRNFKEETNFSVSKNNETLIMSDSPERVIDAGILYKDTMQGSGRIMFHHVNAFTEESNAASKKHIVVAVENTNPEPVTLIIENKTVKGPTTDQLYIGQQLLADYLKGKAAETYTVQPGETIYIYNSNSIRWAAEEVISGMMDFTTSAPLTMRVAAIHATTDISEIATLPFLEKDVHPRGTFFTTDISYDVKPDRSQPTRLIIGDRNADVEIGLDGITGEAVINTGNFGISYHFTISPEEDTAIILNPRGGIFRGAIKWDDKDVYMLPDIGFLPGAERAALIGVVKAGETRTFEYILPNGSNAPVLIGFVPKDNWDER